VSVCRKAGKKEKGQPRGSPVQRGIDRSFGLAYISLYLKLPEEAFMSAIVIKDVPVQGTFG
jgi:hypothetical protein